MNNTTVLYYSSNREDELFEQKVIDDLKKKTKNHSIVSVTHKPTSLGNNICVGTHEACDFNLYKQILVGVRAIKTKYVLLAEADCFYPEDYFDFEPKTDELYRFNEVWILKKWGGDYHKKEFSECAQISSRDYLLNKLEPIFKNRPEWAEDKNTPFVHVYKKRTWRHFGNGGACINIKTGDGLRAFTGTIRNLNPRKTLPGWGSASQFRKRVFDDI